MAGSRLVSVIEHLARAHGEQTSFQERMGVLQASLYMSLPNDAIKRLMQDLLQYCKIQLRQEVYWNTFPAPI